MTKNDIAARLCDRIPDLTRSMALHVADALPEILSDAFARGENLYLRGLGTFEVKTAKEKKARDISRKATVTVPAHRTVRFKISKLLKKRMNHDTMD